MRSGGPAAAAYMPKATTAATHGRPTAISRPEPHRTKE